MEKKNTSQRTPKGPSLSALLKPYSRQIAVLAFFAVAASAINLILPKISSHAIDHFIRRTFVTSTFIWEYAGVAALIFVFTYAQIIIQTYASERVAKDLREAVAAKVSKQTFTFIDKTTPAKILTNLTSDIDSIKTFVAQAVASIISSMVLVVGAFVLLLTIDWRLALAVIAIIPLIGISFFIVLGQVRSFMLKAREVIDWLNRVINESILGAPLIRVLNSYRIEHEKFKLANSDARNVGFSILKKFASLIPVITFLSNLATLIIVALGGHFVINRSMTLGDFSAFNSYVGMMIFPILLLGIMGNVISQASASYARVSEVLNAPDPEDKGTVAENLKGNITVKDISLTLGDKQVLKDVSFNAKAGTKNAIIGPTAAGKTQLLYLLIGLLVPQKGSIEYDGVNIDNYQKESLHNQVGFVFQDSIIFNLTLRENIAFSSNVTEEALQRAIKTAELDDFIKNLPDGLETVVSERGTSLSGGQKQRIMLARALALNPRILLLDDFTARVDANTEKKILDNVAKNYPHITLVSVTQKIGSVEHYEQIVLLMEGEVLAIGTHEDLMKTSPEYVQIYNSQRSTSSYE